MFASCTKVSYLHKLVDVTLCLLPVLQKMCIFTHFITSLRAACLHIATVFSRWRLPDWHKARLILSYSFTCVLQSNEDIGLPVWLLSYYKTEVVSCHLCMIADSLSQVKCVSFTQTSSYSCCHSLRLHLYIPRLEFHSERLQNTKSIPSTDWGGGTIACLVLHAVSFWIRFGVWRSSPWWGGGAKVLADIWLRLSVVGLADLDHLSPYSFRPSATWVTSIVTPVCKLWTHPPQAQSFGTPRRRGVAVSVRVYESRRVKRQPGGEE